MAVSTITPLQNLKPVHLGVKGAYVDRALFVHIRDRFTWPAYVDYAENAHVVGRVIGNLGKQNGGHLLPSQLQESSQ